MFDIHNYASFIAAIIVFQAIPGPGTIAILDATARRGIGAGVGAVLGTLSGDFLYMVAAVAGLAAVMDANPGFLRALQWFGAAYLCWMGLRLLVAHMRGHGAAASRASASASFRRALAVSLTNPKVILFFFAFFPLFLRPESPRSALAAMMAHVVVISFVYQAGLVLAGNAVARRLESAPWARRLATRLAGIALVGFGIRLAASDG